MLKSAVCHGNRNCISLGLAVQINEAANEHAPRCSLRKHLWRILVWHSGLQVRVIQQLDCSSPSSPEDFHFCRAPCVQSLDVYECKCLTVHLIARLLGLDKVMPRRTYWHQKWFSNDFTYCKLTLMFCLYCNKFNGCIGSQRQVLWCMPKESQVHTSCCVPTSA